MPRAKEHARAEREVAEHEARVGFKNHPDPSKRFSACAAVLVAAATAGESLLLWGGGECCLVEGVRREFRLVAQVRKLQGR